MREGWSITTISGIADVQSGSGFPVKYQGELGLEFPFYKVSDMNILGACSGNDEILKIFIESDMNINFIKSEIIKRFNLSINMIKIYKVDSLPRNDHGKILYNSKYLSK